MHFSLTYLSESLYIPSVSLSSLKRLGLVIILNSQIKLSGFNFMGSVLCVLLTDFSKFNGKEVS